MQMLLCGSAFKQTSTIAIKDFTLHLYIIKLAVKVLTHKTSGVTASTVVRCSEGGAGHVSRGGFGESQQSRRRHGSHCADDGQGICMYLQYLSVSVRIIGIGY